MRKTTPELNKETASLPSYKVNTYPNDFNSNTLFNFIDSGIIFLPAFQRSFVWDRKRSSRFIESLIIGLPVPQLFLYKEKDNTYSVIDGQQRLLSLYYFYKGRFPKTDKRAVLRKELNIYGRIRDEILYDNNYFSDFKLQFDITEDGVKNPLHGKMYSTLDEAVRRGLDFYPIRSMTITQLNPDEDDGSIYEIFSRLNTGGVNLTPQEIRCSLYHSEFYRMVFGLNSDCRWRKIYGKDEDPKFKDFEVILRFFALYCHSDSYSGSMIRFLNRFSSIARSFDEVEIKDFENLFIDCITICENIDPIEFRSRTGALNSSLFDAVFVTIAKNIKSRGIQNAQISNESLLALKNDSLFKEAITHSTSHVDNVRTRLELAQKYLYGGENV